MRRSSAARCSRLFPLDHARIDIGLVGGNGLPAGHQDAGGVFRPGDASGRGRGGRVDLWRFGAELAALRRHQEEGRGLRHHQHTDELFHRLEPREQVATLAAAEAVRAGTGWRRR